VINKTVTLIVGAGGSIPYGFPSGSDLVRQLILIGDNPNNNIATRAILELGHFDPSELAELQSKLRLSQRSSIDAFLERNRQFERIGKAAIAVLLSRNENYEQLYASNENWYQYLFELFVRDSDRKSLMSGKLRIITYNYDRSFDFFLWNAMRQMVPDDAAASLIYGTFPIVHVHGALGNAKVSPSASGRSYVPVTTEEELKVATEGIRIIYEEVGEIGNLTAAQSLLDDSESIVFLGFGYNSTNIRRLRIGEHSVVSQRIFGSTFGLTDSERDYLIPHYLRQASSVRFECKTTLQFLKDNLEIFF